MNSTSGFKCSNKIELTKVLNSCRVCMARSVTMKNIFDTEQDNIIEKIYFCTGLTLEKDDGLPTNICKLCHKNLAIAFKFKTSCILANETFRKLIVPIKIEQLVTECIDNDDYNDNGEYNDVTYLEEFTDNDQRVKEEVKDEELVLPMENIKKEVESALATPTPPQKRGKGRPPRPDTTRRYKKNKFKKLQCEPCGMKFANREQSARHRNEAHKEMWVCEICGKNFIHRASHYSHIRSHQPPQYGCDHCEYKTWHRHDLVKHLLRHSGKKMYQCEYCTEAYYTSSNLTSHIRRTHLKEKRFTCSICKKTFFDSTKLRRHIDSHNDIKRFGCDICHTSFTRRCYWKRHLLTQHNIDTPRQRPGRQKTNYVIGEDLLTQTGQPLQNYLELHNPRLGNNLA